MLRILFLLLVSISITSYNFAQTTSVKKPAITYAFGSPIADAVGTTASVWDNILFDVTPFSITSTSIPASPVTGTPLVTYNATTRQFTVTGQAAITVRAEVMVASFGNTVTAREVSIRCSFDALNTIRGWRIPVGATQQTSELSFETKEFRIPTTGSYTFSIQTMVNNITNLTSYNLVGWQRMVYITVQPL